MLGTPTALPASSAQFWTAPDDDVSIRIAWSLDGERGCAVGRLVTYPYQAIVSFDDIAPYGAEVPDEVYDIARAALLDSDARLYGRLSLHNAGEETRQQMSDAWCAWSENEAAEGRAA